MGSTGQTERYLYGRRFQRQDLHSVLVIVYVNQHLGCGDVSVCGRRGERGVGCEVQIKKRMEMQFGREN